MTGKWSVYGNQVDPGVKLAVKRINDAGGINGHPLEVVVEDSASDLSQSAALVRKLAGDPSILGIIGPITTPELIADAPVAESAKILVVSQSAGALTGGFNPWTFRNSVPSSSAIAPVLKAMAAKKGWKKLAVLYDIANDYTTGVRDQVTRAAADLGLTIVTTESFRTGDSDFSSQIAKIAQLKPDVIWPAASATEAGQIIGQIRQKGITADIIGDAAGMNDPAVMKLSGGKAEGLFTYTIFDPTESRPMVKDLVASYSQQYKTVPAQFVALGFDAVLLMASAIKNAKTLDRAGVRDAFASLRGIEGTAATYTYNGPGENQNPGYHLGVLQKDGTYAPVP